MAIYQAASGKSSQAGYWQKAEFLAHCEQSLLGPHFRVRVIVVFRIAYGREQYSIAVATQFICLMGERIPDLIDGISTDDTVGEFDSMSETLTHFFS